MAKQRCNKCERTRKVGEDAFIRYAYRLWCPVCYREYRNSQWAPAPVTMCFNCNDAPATKQFRYGTAVTVLCDMCCAAWTEALMTYGGRTRPTLRERMGASA